MSMTIEDITTKRTTGLGGCDWTGDRRQKSGELRQRCGRVFPVEMSADQMAEAIARHCGDDEVYMVCRLMDLQGGELVHGIWPVSYHASAAGARLELAKESERNMIGVLCVRSVDADGSLPDSWFAVDHTERFVAMEDERHPAIVLAEDQGWASARWAS